MACVVYPQWQMSNPPQVLQLRQRERERPQQIQQQRAAAAQTQTPLDVEGIPVSVDQGQSGQTGDPELAMTAP